jgi:hypothetical protein
LIRVFVGLKRWYLGFSGSRSKFLAMVANVWLGHSLR